LRAGCECATQLGLLCVVGRNRKQAGVVGAERADIPSFEHQRDPPTTTSGSLCFVALARSRGGASSCVSTSMVSGRLRRSIALAVLCGTSRTIVTPWSGRRIVTSLPAEPTRTRERQPAKRTREMPSAIACSSHTPYQYVSFRIWLPLAFVNQIERPGPRAMPMYPSLPLDGGMVYDVTFPAVVMRPMT